MKSLTQPFTRLENRRRALLAELENLPEDRLHHKAGPTKWSIAEILEHLQRAETEVLLHPRHPDFTPPRRWRLKPRLLFQVVLWVVRLDAPVESPSPAMRPTGAKPPPVTLRRWDHLRAGFGEVLGNVTPATANMRVFDHPVAGPLTAPQALELLIAHQEHHFRQIRRTLNEM